MRALRIAPIRSKSIGTVVGLLLCVCLTVESKGQEVADTTATALSMEVGSSVVSVSGIDGGDHTPRIPLQDLDTDPSVSLSHDPGVFSWTFGAAGWPNGLSMFGQDPNGVRVEWDGRTMDDLLVGRPRYDLLPVAMLRNRRWTDEGSIEVGTDPLRTASPLTRVRYESAGDGLQAVRALHVQNRFLATSDSAGLRLQTVFGYAGAGAQGEYDGSQLRRAREITARVGVSSSWWSAWIMDVASRRAVGAHSGVVPFTGATYESIYQRLGATVGDPTARRRTIRNDLEVGGRALKGGWTTSLRGVRSSQTLDFDGNSLQTRGWTTRWHLIADATRSLADFVIGLKADMVRDAGFGGSAWAVTPDSRQNSGISFTVESAARALPGERASGLGDAISNVGSDGRHALSIQAGVRDGSQHAWWHARASGHLERGAFSASGVLKRDARRLSLFEVAGFSTMIAGIPDVSASPLQETQLASIKLGVHRGPLRAALNLAHLREESAAIHQLDAIHPGLVSRIQEGVRTRTTSTLTIGWRDDGRKGLYGRTSGSLQTSSGPNADLESRIWERSMPEQWASARIGWRALLFQNDLDLDVYLRGRIWSSMNGLRLHTPTGLLVLPVDESEPVEGNWLVDLGAEGDVRGATFFFAYENMFSGTTWLFGNLIVPDYPLPQQRIRFGVYWPIAN